MSRTNYNRPLFRGMTGMRFGLGLMAGLLFGLILIVSTSVPIPGLYSFSNGQSPGTPTREMVKTNASYTGVTGNDSFTSGNGITETLTAVASTTAEANTTKGTQPFSLAEVFGSPSSAQPAPSSVDSIATRPVQDSLLVLAPLVVAICAAGLVYLAGRGRKGNPE